MGTCQSLNSAETLQCLKSFTSTMKDLCQPLERFGIKFFTYSRLYKDNKGIFLCNNDGWYQTKFENDLFEHDGFITVKSLYKNDFTKSIFTGVPSKKIKLLQFMYDLDLWNSIDLYKYEEDYKEVFHFASGRENSEIINFYINNLSFLENFSYYFREKASRIIASSPKEFYINIKESSNALLIEDEALSTNSNLTPSQNITLDLNGKWITFSHRQIQCLSLLYLGKTAKESGQILSLSYRTVESYLDNIKLKLDCHTKKDIINLLFAHKAERSFLLGISEVELNNFRRLH